MSLETHTGLSPKSLSLDQLDLNHGPCYDVKSTQVPETDSDTDCETPWLPETPWIPSIWDYLESLSYSPDEACDAEVARILAKKIAKDHKSPSRLAKVFGILGNKKPRQKERQAPAEATAKAFSAIVINQGAPSMKRLLQERYVFKPIFKPARTVGVFPSNKIYNGPSGDLKIAPLTPEDYVVDCTINPSKKTIDNANASGESVHVKNAKSVNEETNAKSVNVETNAKWDGSKFKDVWEEINALAEILYEEPTDIVDKESADQKIHIDADPGPAALEPIPTDEKKKKTGLFQQMFSLFSCTSGHGHGRHGNGRNSNGNIYEIEEHEKETKKKKQSIFGRIRKIFRSGKKTE